MVYFLFSIRIRRFFLGTSAITMGLDLVCGYESARVGSYSTVHVQRIGWIKASLEWMKKNHKIPQSLSSRLSELLTKEKNPYDPNEWREVINYRVFLELASHFPKGVVVFVNHSDCDGEWSPDESQQMLDILDNISVHLEKTEECRNWFDHDDLGNKEYYLVDILRTSVQTDCPIEFC